jgi:hypothetical protein
MCHCIVSIHAIISIDITGSQVKSLCPQCCTLGVDPSFDCNAPCVASASTLSPSLRSYPAPSHISRENVSITVLGHHHGLAVGLTTPGHLSHLHLHNLRSPMNVGRQFIMCEIVVNRDIWVGVPYLRFLNRHCTDQNGQNNHTVTTYW